VHNCINNFNAERAEFSFYRHNLLMQYCTIKQRHLQRDKGNLTQLKRKK